jgi:hypothetical protein
MQEDSVKYLHRLAQEPGRYRNVVQRIMAAHSLANAAKTKATYSKSELDYAGSLVGARWEIPHTSSPFGGGSDDRRGDSEEAAA